ncbi:hypothetical protein M0R45_032143 [Rubus argutus]|uniref:NADH dehydrogenase subunit 5 n=1 Tax=Rubus argutus TaxID=59490 RepID=A0AAW1WGV4_RUBAR
MNFYYKISPFYLFALVCHLLTNHGDSISIGRYTYTVHMEKLAMPNAFINHRNWYSSIIDFLSFASSSSIDQHKTLPSPLYTSLVIMLFMVLVLLYR